MAIVKGSLRAKPKRMHFGLLPCLVKTLQAILLLQNAAEATTTKSGCDRRSLVARQLPDDFKRYQREYLNSGAALS